MKEDSTVLFLKEKMKERTDTAFFIGSTKIGAKCLLLSSIDLLVQDAKMNCM